MARRPPKRRNAPSRRPWSTTSTCGGYISYASRTAFTISSMPEARCLSGAPDITALITEGGVCRALPLELKSDVGKMSEKQLDVQGQIGTVLVRDFDTAKRLIDDFIQGKPCL